MNSTEVRMMQEMRKQQYVMLVGPFSGEKVDL